MLAPRRAAVRYALRAALLLAVVLAFAIPVDQQLSVASASHTTSSTPVAPGPWYSSTPTPTMPVNPASNPNPAYNPAYNPNPGMNPSTYPGNSQWTPTPTPPPSPTT